MAGVGSAQTEELFTLLDDGEAEEYVEARLFGDRIESFDRHIERKKALGDRARYAILYLLYEYGEMSRKTLSTEVGRSSNYLEQPLKELRDVNLIERIPGPPDADQRKTYYRITMLGRQEIASDIRNIRSVNPKEWYQWLVDPEMEFGTEGSDGRIRYSVAAEQAEELRSKQVNVRSRYKEFEQTSELEQQEDA
jgi:DNA-binding MarR family transcriptional regulator